MRRIVPGMPDAIRALPMVWQEIFLQLSQPCTYKDIWGPLRYKSLETCRYRIKQDADRPEPHYLGNRAYFDRADVVLWAYRRSLRLREVKHRISEQMNARRWGKAWRS